MIRVFSTCLVWVLIVQFMISPVLPQFVKSAYAAESKKDPVLEAVQSFEDKLGYSNENTMAPAVQEQDLLLTQYRREYTSSLNEKGEVVTSLVKEYPLFTIRSETEPVAVVDYQKEISFAYDKDSKELRIQRVAYDKKLDRRVLTDEHVFKNIVLYSSVESDANFVYFSTAEGVRMIDWPQIRSANFVTSIAAPVVVPTLIAKIRGLEILTRATKPRQLKSPKTNYHVEGQSLASNVGFDGELIVKYGEYGANEEVRIPFSELILNYRQHQLKTLLLGAIANPDLERLNDLQKIFAENSKDIEILNKAKKAVLGSAKNDLVEFALTSRAQRLGFDKTGGFLKKDASGKDTYEKLADLKITPRDAIILDPSADSQWSKDHATIQAAREKETQDKTPRKKFRDILVEDFKSKENEKLMEKSAKLEQTVVKRISDRIAKAHQKFVASKGLQVLAAAVAVLSGVIAGDHFFNGAGIRAWGLSLAYNILIWSTTAPGIGMVTKPIVDSAGYFKSGLSPVLRTGLATGLIIALQPLSMILAKVASLKSGKGWNRVTAFFNYGLRVYAIMCYPVQKLVWDLFQQENLYRAMDSNLNPLKHKEAFNNPLALEKEKAKLPEKLDRVISREAALKSRALVLAAAYVSHQSEKEGRAVDVATLLLTGFGKRVETVADILSNSSEGAKWAELTKLAYNALAELGDNPELPLDEKNVSKYVELYQSLVKDFDEVSIKNPSLALKTKRTLKVLVQNSKDMMSKNILSYALFGKQGYDLYRQFKNVEVDSKTAEIANETFSHDYISSSVIYALSVPRKFGEVVVAGPAMPEILSNQLGQIFIFGVQGAADVISMANANSGFVNGYEPLTVTQMSEYSKRTQTVGEGFKAIAKQAFSPTAQSYLDAHSKYMQNTLTGFQGRFMNDYFLRLFGVGLTKFQAGLPIGAGIIFDTAQLSSFFLLNKIAFQADGVGYAIVWPYVQLSIRHMKDVAEQNKILLQLADYLLDLGLKMKNQRLIALGAEAYQGLYALGGTKLPEKFQVAVENYDENLAKELLEHRKEVVPVATESSKVASFILNFGVGSIVSTILFDHLSSIAYNPATDPTEELAKAAINFAATYAILKAAAPVTKGAVSLIAKASAAVKTRFGGCEDKLVKAKK